MTIKYDLTGFYNLREGGGMPAQGGRVRTERLIRSDFPESLDAEDAEFFKDIPTAVVIDLRDASEVKSSPAYFADAGLKVVERPILAGSVASMLEEVPTVEELYLHMVEQSAPALAAAVADVADAVDQGAAVVHCTAGKDRTGVVIALIQAVLGVSDADIRANYQQSQANLSGAWVQDKLARLKGLAAAYPQFANVDLSAVEPLMTGSPAPAIQAVLDAVRNSHKTVEEFLTANGLTAQQLQQLKDHLVEAA